jgi:uncharacterized RDD family membrane protein YckC
MELDDRLTIPTPEGVQLDLVLAGPGSRFTAAAVDWVIQLVLLALAALTLLAGGNVGYALFAIVAFIVFFGYDVLFEVFNSGRTPGKRLNGLRVVRGEGQPVTFTASAIRNLLRLVDILPGMYLVGGTAILVSSRNQRLGDMAADTLVVRERREIDRRLAEAAAPVALAEADAYAAWDVTAVTAEELAAVRSFLERRYDLKPRARERLATTLAQRLRPKVAGVQDPISAEAFLARLAAAKLARR